VTEGGIGTSGFRNGWLTGTSKLSLREKGHGVIQITVRAEFRSVPINWLWVQVCG
jgi:hypothetical protein